MKILTRVQKVFYQNLVNLAFCAFLNYLELFVTEIPAEVTITWLKTFTLVKFRHYCNNSLRFGRERVEPGFRTIHHILNFFGIINVHEKSKMGINVQIIIQRSLFSKTLLCLLVANRPDFPVVLPILLVVYCEEDNAAPKTKVLSGIYCRILHCGEENPPEKDIQTYT